MRYHIISYEGAEGGEERFSPTHGVRSPTGPGSPHYREYTIRLKTHYIQ